LDKIYVRTGMVDITFEQTYLILYCYVNMDDFHNRHCKLLEHVNC